MSFLQRRERAMPQPGLGDRPTPAETVRVRGTAGSAWVLGIGASLILLGCASRSLPKSYPADAPVSRQVPEARPAEVTRALASDPPLPGEAARGWPGLAEEASAGAGEPSDRQRPDGGAAGEAPAQGQQGHEHHHGGHQHGAH